MASGSLDRQTYGNFKLSQSHVPLQQLGSQVLQVFCRGGDLDGKLWKTIPSFEQSHVGRLGKACLKAVGEASPEYPPRQRDCLTAAGAEAPPQRLAASPWLWPSWVGDLPTRCHLTKKHLQLCCSVRTFFCGPCLPCVLWVVAAGRALLHLLPVSVSGSAAGGHSFLVVANTAFIFRWL